MRVPCAKIKLGAPDSFSKIAFFSLNNVENLLQELIRISWLEEQKKKKNFNVALDQ